MTGGETGAIIALVGATQRPATSRCLKLYIKPLIRSAEGIRGTARGDAGYKTKRPPDSKQTKPGHIVQDVTKAHIWSGRVRITNSGGCAHANAHYKPGRQQQQKQQHPPARQHNTTRLVCCCCLVFILPAFLRGRG